MCDWCVAATVGEAERHYENLEKGESTSLMTHFAGNDRPRSDLQLRQREELQDPTFLARPEDQAFRADLQSLCDGFGTPSWNAGKTHPAYAFDTGGFEAHLVALRRYHGRKVLSNEQMRQLIAAAQQSEELPVRQPPGAVQRVLTYVTG